MSTHDPDAPFGDSQLRDIELERRAIEDAEQDARAEHEVPLCADCGDEGEHRPSFDQVLCGPCFRTACDEVDADRLEHADRDEGRL